MMGKTAGAFNTGSGASMSVSFLLHHGWLLLAHAGQSLLNPAREFFLPVELDLRVPLGHPYRAVAGCTSDRAKNLPEFKQIQYSDHTTSA